MPLLSACTDTNTLDCALVYLRLLPISGGEPRVLAYLYGGQGTINVPSWSPDGSRLAFVSNTVPL